MQHFKRLRESVDVHPVLAELRVNQDAWTAQTGRQQRVAVQAQTNAIPLRGLRRSKICGRRRRDVHESRYTGLAARFPRTVALLEGLVADMGGQLGRAKIARLPPGAHVLPHVDRGAYYRQRDRYHLVIDSNGQSVLAAADEQVSMQPGELWWFDNQQMHSATNGSDQHRIHLVFDVDLRGDQQRDATAAPPLPDPHANLNAVRALAPNSPIEIVTMAVQLYQAICRNPSRWDEVLQQNDCVEQAQQEPLTVLTQLVLPDRKGRDRQRHESAIAWSLAQIDLGRLRAHQVPAALRAAGGVTAIHRAWRKSKDQLLYVDSPLRPVAGWVR